MDMLNRIKLYLKCFPIFITTFKSAVKCSKIILDYSNALSENMIGKKTPENIDFDGLDRFEDRKNGIKCGLYRELETQ